MRNRGFEFNGISTDSLGLIVTNRRIYKTPSRNQKLISIPGRTGDAVDDEGTYPNIPIEYEVGSKNISRVFDYMADWLCVPGYHKLIDSRDLGYYRRAVCTSGSDWEEEIKNFGRSKISFSCIAYRYLLAGLNVITLTKPAAIINDLLYPSEPYIKIFGSGDITLMINNVSYPVKDVNSFIEIDSEELEVFKGEESLNDKANFKEFPLLVSGDNRISWTGNVSKVEIIPNWRRL